MQKDSEAGLSKTSLKGPNGALCLGTGCLVGFEEGYSSGFKDGIEYFIKEGHVFNNAIGSLIKQLIKDECNEIWFKNFINEEVRGTLGSSLVTVIEDM